MLEPLLLRTIQRLRSRAIHKQAQSGFRCISSYPHLPVNTQGERQRFTGRLFPPCCPTSHRCINRLQGAEVHSAEARSFHGLRESIGPATLPRSTLATATRIHSIQLVERTRKFSSSPTSDISLLPLNDLRGSPGSRRVSKRLGRGIGSGKGKTSGRGHKGQKARSGNKPKIGFEGGQTPLRLRLPKRGFHNPFKKEFQVVNVKDILRKIEDGYIDPTKLITMKTLKDVGLGGKATRDGIKLLGKGVEELKVPLHIEVSRASTSVRDAVTTAGGSLLRVHYNTLGLRALLTPEWFAKKGRLLPRAAEPPPKVLASGAVDCAGRLPAPSEPLAKVEGEGQVA